MGYKNAEEQKIDAILREWGERRRELDKAICLYNPCLSDNQFIGYCDKTLSLKEKQEVESHFVECDLCLHYYATMKRTLDMFEQGNLPKVPGEVFNRLIKYINKIK